MRKELQWLQIRFVGCDFVDRDGPEGVREGVSEGWLPLVQAWCWQREAFSVMGMKWGQYFQVGRLFCVDTIYTILVCKEWHYLKVLLLLLLYATSAGRVVQDWKSVAFFFEMYPWMYIFFGGATTGQY